MYCSVVQEREEELVAYLRWVRGSGKLMPRHAEPIAKSTCGEGWGLEKGPRTKKTMLKPTHRNKTQSSSQHDRITNTTTQFAAAVGAVEQEGFGHKRLLRIILLLICLHRFSAWSATAAAATSTSTGVVWFYGAQRLERRLEWLK